MSKEIIINVSGDQSRIAIVEDGELVELYVENPENVRTIGDIYLGRVRRILPGIKAAFVDIGQKQDAFLHFSDLSENLPQLLDISKGEVPDRKAQPLPTAPKTEGESTLELESPEEQRAAKRRRDLKRSRGKGRRKKEQPKEQPEAEAPETEATEATAEAEPKRPRGRQRRPASAEPAAPPEIIPADAVEPPPQKAEADGGDASPEQAEAEPKPKRARGRRGGRGRRRGEDQPEQAAEAVEATPEDAAAAEPVAAEETAEAKPKPKRARGRRKPEAPAEPAEDAGAEDADAEDAAPRRRGRGATAPTETPEAPAAEEPTKPAAESEAPARAERSRSEPAKPEPAKPEPAKPEPASPRSSRFVIDLTSKPGRVSPRREEEEEEEEREAKPSRSRRSAPKRRGQRSADEGRGRSRDRDDDDRDEERGSGRRNGNGANGNGRSRSEQPSGPRPETYLKQDQRIIVKITKEPISSKGPRVSTDISLAGRFLVLIPMTDYVAVSKKIESAKERRRLRALARSLLPEGFGLIVRTVAENRDAKALDTDLRLLLQKWRKIEEQLRAKPEPPVRLYEDVNMVSSIVRDLFSEDYDRITIDDPKAFRNVKSYVQAVAPQMAEVVQLHKSAEPVFRKAGIEKDVRAAFESRVSLPGGGYLFVEHTEAMHVVDVNSGRAGKGMNQEENALKVNLEAAREIAKQLRLRDLGGIIVVDFIDMRSESYRKKVYDELKKQFRRDRAVTKLLPMSDFGLVQITRQRLRPSITTTVDVDEFAPLSDEPEPEPQPERAAPAKAEARAEAGPQPTASEVVAHLERWLATYRDEVSERHLKRPVLIRVHPFLAAYLQRGIPSTFTRWKFKTRLKMALDVDEAAPPLSFSVRDEKSGKNLTKKYDPARRDGERDEED